MPKKLTAFTLAELLVVLVIMGILLTLSSGMSRRARDTFVAQQYVKTEVVNTRILRRKSMLITRNSAESEWVHGVGFRLEKQSNGQWAFIQVKALGSSTASSSFYQSFPTNDPCVELDWDSVNSCSSINELKLRKIEEAVQLLPEGMNVVVEKQGAPVTCLSQTQLSALTVIFESINGNLHVYCKNSSGVDLSIGSNPNISLKIQYLDNAFYRYKVNITSKGEINAEAF